MGTSINNNRRAAIDNRQYHTEVKRVPKDMTFEDAYHKYRLGNFFRESRETDKDIELLFNKVSRKPKRTLKKEQDPGKFREDLEECGDFGVFWSRLSEELHRRVRCLALDGDFPTYHVSEVMHVLLKRSQYASREEAVEEMKNCPSITQHWCRSTVMPERGPSIFQDRLRPKSHTKLPKYP
ncbi:hypothetical protein DY000_02060845 [Brassica cretica]|uniref:Uncharacterized protein n=1 Tax=Brassica cretica TaxID=69181 RepID=A0ABQ7B4N9_BRACR|nr:hypothetical protein DY000_02060845 [Brassica cretica]